VGVIRIFNVIMAVGNAEIEDTISAMPNISRAESVDSIDLIEEILTYENYDYIIVNTLLSARKTAKLADYIENSMDSEVKPKIIVLVESLSDKKLTAQLVGLGVNAFVTFNELSLVGRYMEHYPDNFDLSMIANKNSKADITATRVVNGTISIGVFNLDNGAGATTSSLKLAEEIANCGYQVICLEIDQENFCSIKKKPKNLELISTGIKEKDTILQLAFGDNSYQFIIIDFGRLFKVNMVGELISANQQLLGDFLRCNYKVGMCFASPWHNDKMNLFLKNDLFQSDLFNNQLFLLASGNGESEKNLIEDYHELPINRRDEMRDFTEGFKRILGISGFSTRKEKRKSIFRRKR